MSLNFARSYINKRQNNKIANTVAPKKDEKQKSKKTFVHGNNVLLINGTYKGYYGYVSENEFKPQTVDLYITDTIYVPVQSYDNLSVGSNIYTEFGQGKIVNRIPALVGIEVTQDGGNKTEMRFEEDALMRVIVHKNANGKLHIGNLVRVMPEGSKVTCEVQTLHVGSKQTNEDGILKEFSGLVRKTNIDTLLNKESQQLENCDSNEIVLKDVFMVVRGPSVSHIGMYGTFTRTIPEQYAVQITKRISVLASNISLPKADVGMQVQVLKGVYKNQTGTIVQRHPPRLGIYIDAIGKTIHEHLVAEGKSFELRPITSNDVFYMDIELKNGNVFQVKKILDNGNIIGIEKNSGFSPREITPNDIRKTLAGFKFTDTAVKQDLTNKSEDLVYFSDDEEHTENNDEDSDDEIDLDTLTEDASNETSFFDDDQELKTSFKDTERIQTAYTELSQQEKSIKNIVTKVINIFGINDSEISIYKVVDDIVSAIKKTKDTINTSQFKDTWIESDERYIIATIVFHEFIKQEYTHILEDNVDNIVGYFVSELANKKYFIQKDTKHSIYLKNGWTSSFQVNENLVESLRQTKDFTQLYQIMFTNCNTHLQAYFNHSDLNTIVRNIKSRMVTPDALIPLGTKRKEVIPTKLLYAKDVLEGNIPPSATKILWAKEYMEDINYFKTKLSDKIKNAPNKSTKVVYEYVLNNIEQAPFELEKLKTRLKSGKGVAIDQPKYTQLSKTWNMLLEYIRYKYNLLQQQKLEKTSQIEQMRQDSLLKRKEAMSDKLTNPFNKLSIDESNDTENEIERTFKKLKLGKNK